MFYTINPLGTKTSYGEVVTLQQSYRPLADTAHRIGREKDSLQDNFIGFGSNIIREMHDYRYLVNPISLSTSCPHFSRPKRMFEKGQIEPQVQLRGALA